LKKSKNDRLHIGIFGRRNVGKSSLINAISNQKIAIVSEIPGTTTDPVKKSIELKNIGAVVIIDTAGIDDTNELGKLRVDKTFKTIEEIDIAILVIAENKFSDYEDDLIQKFFEYEIPFIIVANKSDIYKIDYDLINKVFSKYNLKIIEISAEKNNNIDILLNELAKINSKIQNKKKSLIGDLVQYGDIVLLITPIDNEAPEGRLILPQVQIIRDILDNDCVAIVMKEKEVEIFLKKTGIKPKLAITDSQIFNRADAIIPKDIPLTSFSIILANNKGDFEEYLKGTPKISELKDGDKILLLESCTHQVSCDDIGRVKIPRWLSSFTGKKLEFTVVSGLDKLPDSIDEYSLVIQCGGCVVTKKQLQNRIKKAVNHNIPITNYGMAIAYLQGIYQRAISPFVKNFDTKDLYL
jgi:[FeFe] hydrogenase H-cluster maturation GTPase HydF